jgi:hypothetical protein
LERPSDARHRELTEPKHRRHRTAEGKEVSSADAAALEVLTE